MSGTRAKSPRYLFIDRLRGWAVIVMIETHVVNALLETARRGEPAHAVLNFINGLVAPSFLFCAGFSFAIASRRKWAEYITFSPSARAYARRLLFILLVGYSLHLPFFSLRRMMDLTDAASWTSFFQVDILQTIAVSLLLLLGMAAVVRSRRAHLQATLALILSFVFFAPLINNGHFDWMPIWFRGYISHAYASQFPLFPWAAFLLSGHLLGDAFLRFSGTNRSRFIKILVLASIAGIACSLLAAWLPVRIYPGLPFWGDSPQFVLLRLSIIVLMLTLLYAIEPVVPPTTQPPGHSAKANGLLSIRAVPTIPLLFGRESLLVYTVHLLIVYGHDYDWSLVRTFGPTLPYIKCFEIFAFVTLAMYLLALVWDRLKAYNISWAKKVQYAIVAIAILRFVTA